VIRAGVVGANGYAGAEVVRWLLEHPDVDLQCVVSRTHAGRPLADVVPALAGLTNLRCEDVDVERLAKLDAVFLATSHGAARELAASLARVPIVLDLSMDHRLDPAWAYGLVEWNADRIATARRIAVPGCFATAILLALAPFVAAGGVGRSVAVAAATGSTGSGAAPQAAAHHPERFANLRAYKVLEHQHVAEIQRFLATLGPPPRIDFVPMSAPLDRGILVAAFVPSIGDPNTILERAYGAAPLVRIRRESPEVRHVRGTAFADLSVTLGEGTVVVLAAIDNLGKGAASQAVSCLNLAHGLPVDRGLRRIPCTP
jgi:N-acetyl-gamma-glutamyl-phosphate reductase common form